VIGGIMEHVEQAGIHSGDSTCSLPPYSLPPAVQDTIRRHTQALAFDVGVRLAGIAARVITGEKLKDIRFTREIVPPHYSVKGPVFPFNKFPGTDIIL